MTVEREGAVLEERPVPRGWPEGDDRAATIVVMLRRVTLSGAPSRPCRAPRHVLEPTEEDGRHTLRKRNL